MLHRADFLELKLNLLYPFYSGVSKKNISKKRFKSLTKQIFNLLEKEGFMIKRLKPEGKNG